MDSPRLFTSQNEIQNIKRYIKEYSWYNESYLKIKNFTDTIIEKGFSVPDESGYVFFDTCPRDNTKLIFDPYREDRHICPECGVNYTDEPYRRAWVLNYHAWLSQISINLGIIYLIDGNNNYAKAVHNILCDYSKKYQKYPNDDNELGPTRVFQSTYMESVWLMYLAGAYDMVRQSGVFSEIENKNIENNLFRASAKIIMDYDELWNNRQAFNNAGICAVGYLYKDVKLINHALYGEHGFVSHMENSILEDGLWYEGDNYHFATLPSMVNIAEMALRNGEDLYKREFNGHTINMMFMAPLKSLQPDFTFPSRKDSAYASGIARKWYTGLYETAYTRYKESAYADILEIAYAFKMEDEGSRSGAAGIMDIFKSEVSRRTNLDWRGFLNATPELHGCKKVPYPDSINMTGTGLAVLRKNDTYLSLDYGDYGGGHGHPDRLNINYFYKGKRWLSDFGTCNYYFDQLRWYRSTIGHNTLVIDGNTQLPVNGSCTGFETKNRIGFVSGAVKGVAPGVDMDRMIIMLEEGILLDVFSAESNEFHNYHYALHSFGDLEIEKGVLHESVLTGENYEFIKDVKSAEEDGLCARFVDGDDRLIIRLPKGLKNRIFSGTAMGPPDYIPERFPVFIAEKKDCSAKFITVIEALQGNESDKVSSLCETKGEISITLNNDDLFKVRKESDGIVIEKYCNQVIINRTVFQMTDDQSSNNQKSKLTGATEKIPETITAYAKAYSTSAKINIDNIPWNPNILINSKSQMRRGDKDWGGTSDISGEAMVFNRGNFLTVKCKVTDDTVLFSGGKYPYDNDSIQVYIGRRDDRLKDADEVTKVVYGFLLVPGVNGNISCLKAVNRSRVSTEKTIACVKLNDTGYEAFIDIPWENIGGIPKTGEVMGFDIILNDRDTGERRDFQMVWSGCFDDERIYLKEDSHNPLRLGSLEIQ